jgi:hypothetical protein
MPAGDISDALVAEVLAHQFNSSYSDRIYTWLDKAQKEIARKANVRTQQDKDTLAGSAGAQTLNVPADYARLISLTRASVSDTETDPLQPFDARTYDEYYNSSITGTPYGYTISGSQILLIPKLDTATNFYIRFWKLPATITTSVDPEIPADYHSLLVDYALHRAYLSQHDRQMATYHRTLYDNALAELQGQVHGDHQDGPLVTPGTWYNAYASSNLTIPS